VKRYSSGMYVRLAFAVAAHLEPEILIVDEVLAVGDAQFQKKCLGKMEDVANEGRTILFVSHTMSTVRRLCPTSILLKQGSIFDVGPSDRIIESYLQGVSGKDVDLSQENIPERSGSGKLRITAAYLATPNGMRTKIPISGDPIDIVLEFNCKQNLPHLRFGLTIINHLDVCVTHCNMIVHDQTYNMQKSIGKVVCRIPKLPLPLGSYRIAASAHNESEILDLFPNVCVFDVEACGFFVSSNIPTSDYSTALVEHSWLLN
jgi:lipopolysaccharide transport system ATP-binding protein